MARLRIIQRDCMAFRNRKGVWYGMLESVKKGNAVVIWDPILPEAGEGKVFLYNTNKDRVVEYVEAIVVPKLRDLGSKELSDAKRKFATRWEEMRIAYIPEEEPESMADMPNLLEEHIELDIDLTVHGDDIDMDDELDMD